MTIASQLNRITYTGNGSTTAFSVSFPFQSTGDLVVVETIIATGVQTTKTITTHYTVSGSTDSLGYYPNGGTVTAVTAPASTVTWTIYRAPALLQSLNLSENNALPAESLEAQLDYVTMLMQRLHDRVNRSLRQPDGDSADLAVLPAKVTRASTYLAFNAAGDPIATTGTTEANPVSAFMATVLDDTTAAAARATLGAGGAEPSDDVFRVVGSADATKKLAFEVDGNTTATTRTITPPNQDLVMERIWSGANDFRVTVTTATPVTTADVTAATTLYWTPYVGHRIALYDGTNWILRTTTEKSIAVPATTNTMYDVFVYDNSGTPTLELTAWTNDTTRATALTYQDGVLVKTGAVTRRYVGSFRTTGVSGQTEDSLVKRYVWNYYHRVIRAMKAIDTTDSWTYTTNTIRQANANAANQLDYVCGVSEDTVEATVAGSFNNGNSVKAAVYIGVDSTTANSAQVYGGLRGDTGSTHYLQPHAHYRGYPGAGRHYLTWLESSTATGTTTWYGDNGAGDQQSGIVGSVRG